MQLFVHGYESHSRLDFFQSSFATAQDSHQLVANMILKPLLLGVLYQSVAGSILSILIHSLILMPLEIVKPLLPSFLALMPSIDRLNKVLPAAALLEEQELEWPVQGNN